MLSRFALKLVDVRVSTILSFICGQVYLFMPSKQQLRAELES
jgi:hypothetical protein